MTRMLDSIRVSKVSFNACWEFGTQLTFPTLRKSVLCTFPKVRKEEPGMWHIYQDIIAKMLKTLRLETGSWVQRSALQSNGWVTIPCFLTSLYLHFLVYKERISESSSDSGGKWALLSNRIKILTEDFSHHSFDLGVNLRAITNQMDIGMIPTCKIYRNCLLNASMIFEFPHWLQIKPELRRRKDLRKGFFLKSCGSTCCKVPSQEVCGGMGCCPFIISPTRGIHGVTGEFAKCFWI